jgi:hypothetical protein
MADKSKLFQRYFRLGANPKAQKAIDKVFPTRQNESGRQKKVDFSPAVQRLWNYWQTQAHDFPNDYKVRRQLWADMDLIYFNCLAGEERLLTQEYGLVPIQEVSGESVTVLSSEGWKPARVKHFGRDMVYNAHFKRRGFRQDRIVRSTLNHRWKTTEGDFIETKNLKSVGNSKDSGHRIPYIDTPRPEVDEESIDYLYGVRHGIIFGDGTTIKTCGRNAGYSIRICSDKEDILPYFENYNTTYPPSFGGDPVVFMWDEFARTHPLKELPPEHETDEYLLGFFRGWLAADGYVAIDGKVSLTCKTDEAEWARRVFPKVGIAFNGQNVQTRRKGKSFIRGKEVISKQELVTIRINNLTLSEDDLLIHRKKDRLRQIQPIFWSFHGLDYNSGKEEDIYCAIVDGPEDFVLEDGLLTGNSALLSRAINLTAAEAIQADSNVQPIWVESNDKKFVDFALKAFDKWGIYRMMEPLARDIVQYGNKLWLTSFDKDGVDEVLPVDIYDFEDRVEFSPVRLRKEMQNRGSFAYRMRDKYQRVDALVKGILDSEEYASTFRNYLFGFQVANQVVPPWRAIHFRNYTTKSPFAPYGVPMFIHSLAPYRQFDVAMTLQVAKRGAEFPIDLYKLNIPSTLNPTDKLEKVIEFIEELDNSGLSNTKKEGPGVGERIVTIQDLFEYDQISPDFNIGRIDDLDLLRDDLIISTGLPREILDPSDGFGNMSGVAVAEQFKPFARLVYGVQTIIMDGISQLLKIHMIQSGEFDPAQVDFELSMPYPESQTNGDIISSQSDLMRLANDILDSLSSKLLGDGGRMGDSPTLPPDLIRSVYQQILPYDQERVDQWVDQTLKAKKAQEDAAKEAGDEVFESIKKEQNRMWSAYKEMSPNMLKETIREEVWKKKASVLREGTMGGKHYFSSRNSHSGWTAEELLKYDKERVQLMKEKDDEEALNSYMKEEVTYSFSEARKRLREKRKEKEEIDRTEEELKQSQHRVSHSPWSENENWEEEQ